MSDFYEGRVYIENGFYIIDAEPYIMNRIRPLFPKYCSYSAESGFYTHKTMKISINNSTSKDVDWISYRFNLEISEQDLEKIKGKARDYDLILSRKNIYDNKLNVSPDFWSFDIPLREHQIVWMNMIESNKRALLADKLGTGKTYSGLSILANPSNRPALIVVPTHLCIQWERECHKLFKESSTHIIKGTKTYDLPRVDIYITSYNRLQYWQDVFMDSDFNIKTLIFDEIHDLRHSDTNKYGAAQSISGKCDIVCGLSGTPIYNNGIEIFNVMEIVSPGSLGDFNEFSSEWCEYSLVKQPAILNKFLKNNGLMLRRSSEDIGLSFKEHSKFVYTIDSDLESLKEVEDIAKKLSMAVLSNIVGESDQAARELDWKLRHATGVAKAKPVSEFVRMILEEEEKVVVSAWHRDVYDILLKELKGFNPVMFTGSESIKEKDEAVGKFINGDSRVFLISLRSGAGLDGLQNVCNTVVFAELDWSPQVMDQVVGRLDRFGQKKHVKAYYLNINDGSDPFILEHLNVKKSQHDGLIDGKSATYEIKTSEEDKIKGMARKYLEKIGVSVKTREYSGDLDRLLKLLKSLTLSFSEESEMQRAVESFLKNEGFSFNKEFKISKKSRLDFVVYDGDEKIVIECKVNSLNRQEVYRQIRRYSEELKPKCVILLAPWQINSFEIDGIPVEIIDYSQNNI